MWLARDEDGSLFLYGEKPSKQDNKGWWFPTTNGVMKIDPDLFPEVKWEDEEPTEVEVTIGIKQEE